MMLHEPISRVGRGALGVIHFVGALGLLIAEAAYESRHLVITRRGRRLAWANLWFQLHRVGVKSIGVVGLVTLSIGVILAMQIGPVLAAFGVTEQLPFIIGVSMFRELGPLVGAIVLTGFAGAAIAAELGSMAVGEEIKALRTHAINPVRFLVVPRVIAAMVMTVCLAVYSDVMGVLGGMLASAWMLGMPMEAYLLRTADALKMSDFFGGLIKAAVFGLLIGSLACYMGMNVRKGAQGVGAATTATVVISIVFLVLVDLMFTVVFYSLGL